MDHLHAHANPSPEFADSIKVISATQSWFGAAAVNVRFTKSGAGAFVALRRCGATLAMAGANQTRVTHQACDPLAPMPRSIGAKLGMNTRCPIRLP
jgi:hypothetical protein